VLQNVENTGNSAVTYEHIMLDVLDDNAAVTETERCYGRPSERCYAVQHPDNMTNKCISVACWSLTLSTAGSMS